MSFLSSILPFEGDTLLLFGQSLCHRAMIQWDQHQISRTDSGTAPLFWSFLAVCEVLLFALYEGLLRLHLTQAP